MHNTHPQLFHATISSSSSSPGNICNRSCRKRRRAPMDPIERRPWSSLPMDILSMIGNRLDTCIDVLRFRSVCSSFRSSIPAPRCEAWRFPLQIQPDLLLRASTIYALGTPDGAAGSGRARWLLKLEESGRGRMRILSLFSQRRIAHLLPHTFPKVLDCHQFRMVEICRQYTLDARGSAADLFPPFVKVVMHPDSVGSDLGQRSVYFLDEIGQLGCWNDGDDNLSLDDGGYSDIVVYEGKVWVVDYAGKLSQMHRSSEHRSFSLPFYEIDGRRRKCHGSSKHLVVSGGDLYLGDRFFGGYGDGHQTAFFIVYRLDQRRGRWEEVRSLGNSAFFICNRDSFVVSAGELDGRGGNCIYHAENHYSKFDVYDLATQRLKWPDKSDFLIGLSCFDDAGR